ncbi:hypothetical protein HanIR_Chr11g0554801 [Helianthus annuus]|nr:hypothetical protein HanIR_Chr11g0554801 [Helianthus annuus]
MAPLLLHVDEGPFLTEGDQSKHEEGELVKTRFGFCTSKDTTGSTI